MEPREGSIAVPVERGTGREEEVVHTHFGRAPHFHVERAGGGSAPEAVPNSAAAEAHGAGTGAAALLAERGVSDVVAGRFGPKAGAALAALGVRMWIAPPGLTVGEALRKCRAGELERFELRRY